MSSALWLLLYLAPLLGLTAVVFAWFGWHWRGSSLPQSVRTPESQPEAETTVSAEKVAEQAAAEVSTLRADLQAAQAAAQQSQDAARKAHEHAQALEAEAAKTLRDLDHLRHERDQAAAALQTAQSELAQLRAQPAVATSPPALTPDETAAPPVAPTPPAKPKRKRTTPAKAKPAQTESIRDKIAALVGELSQHQSVLSTLTQERDGWQRQVAKLAAKTPADPSGLGLARRSLADSEERLQTASTEIARLENQARVLHQAQEKAATLAGVPDDDLTQIKGIKKVINEQLRAYGIRTWKQIAQWDDAELRAFSELLAFKNRAAREQWQEQARALHEAAHGPL